MVVGWLRQRPLFAELGLLALTVLFGLQVLRMLIPGLTWVLGDRLGLGAVELGAVALFVFLAAFLASRLRRWLGGRRLVIITAAGLGLLRLIMQPWWGEPLFNLGLAMVATMLFVLFLPAWLQGACRRGTVGHFALGLLFGLALDTALHGVFVTYDTIWRLELLPVLLTLLLVLVQWLLLAARLASPDFGDGQSDSSGLKSLTWLAIGPFLFLELVVFQNIAHLAAVTGWPLSLAFGWALLAQLAALAAAVWLLRREGSALWPLSLICGTALILVTAFPYPQEAWPAAVAFFTGQLALSVLMVLVLIGLGGQSGKAGFGSVTIASGLGMVLLTVFLLGYYAVYQISLPFSNTILLPIAALVVAVCAWLSSLRLPEGVGMGRRLWLLPGLTAILLVLPLVGALVWQTPETVTGSGYPVRIMTYNLHNGFNTDGHLDMEALAQVIEENQPDIVALQEVSRGWLISGRLDMLSWLSQRLKMPYISGPTADPLWGNAILSRYPIIEYTSYDLPPRDLPIRRGFTAALIDLGGGQRLNVIVTHYHHVEADSAIRQLQSEVIVGFYGGAGGTVLLGDFNAEPDAPEIEMLLNTGLVDTLAAVAPAAVYTFHSAGLYQRIDYIFISPDLMATEVYVPFSNASDHLAIVVVIDR